MKYQFRKDKNDPEMWRFHWLAAQPVRFAKPFWKKLAELETRMVAHRLKPVEDPIYICGLARSGTTICLEALNHHPQTASHCYGDMAQPFLTVMWNRLFMPVTAHLAREQERPHRDGLKMAQDRPEAVEEIFWQMHFKHTHDENRSTLLDAGTRHPTFEQFLKSQLSKFIYARKKERYLAKSNYHLARLRYLKKIFRRPRFIIMVRHPLHHMVSYLKQHRLLSDLYAKDDRWWQSARELGHFEFGPEMQFINVGDEPLINRLRNCWDNRRFAEAFGLYWSSLYGFLIEQLSRDPQLESACMIVRYEDLCKETAFWLGRIFKHCGLDRSRAGNTIARFGTEIRKPDYYSFSLEDDQADLLWKHTRKVAGCLGYSRSA